MKQEKLELILNDIFQLDPKLKKIEKEIRQMIQDILAAQPEISIDANFENRLKQEIMNKISELKNKGLEKDKSLSNSRAAFRFPIHKLAYVAGLTILVFALVISYDFMPENFDQENTQISLQKFDEENNIDMIAKVAKKESFVRSSKEAFGKLSSATNSNTASRELATPEMNEGPSSGVLAMGMGASGSVMGSAAPLGLGGDSAVSSDMKIMPPYEYTNFHYVYKGEEFTQDLQEVDVYKKSKGSFDGQGLVDFLTRLDFGIIDMSKFAGRAEVFNVSFNQDKEFGYSVNINMADNNIFIYSNWLKWPRPDYACRDEACFARYRLKINDILSNEETITIANAFLNEYGIDKNNYGEPIVQDSFRREYQTATDASSVYLPDEVSVVYPLKINDAITVDEGGNPSGLYVSVNMRHKRVSGLNNLSPKTFEVSAYDAITDSQKLISLAEQGGVYPIYYNNEASKTIEVSLGTPSIVLAKQYKYDEIRATSDELYVPALSFPVTDISDKDAYFYRQNIIIPLAADMINDIPEYSVMPVSPMLR